LRRLSSPRPWGCFFYPQLVDKISEVFPTPVGVFPVCTIKDAEAHRLPHARGGVSDACRLIPEPKRSSPRPWGCFLEQESKHLTGLVFPTPVGVFPLTGSTGTSSSGLPHARGGVSIKIQRAMFVDKSSPRPWGCFHRNKIPLMAF